MNRTGTSLNENVIFNQNDENDTSFSDGVLTIFRLELLMRFPHKFRCKWRIRAAKALAGYLFSVQAGGGDTWKGEH